MRRNKLPKPGLQLRMSMFFVSIACMAAVFQVFLINRALMSVSVYLPNDSDVLLDALPEVFQMGMTWTILVMMPIMVLFGMFVTFRIAGPAARMERYLDEIAEGKAPTSCTIRQRDELHELCDALNRGLQALHERQSNGESPAATATSGSNQPELAER